ncbi:hypothetical protein Tco_0830785, partial [Tanacetum coccineum]
DKIYTTQRHITVVTSHVVRAPSIPVPETETKTTFPVRPSIFHDSSSAGTIRLDVAGPSHLPGKELLLGSREINSENLHEVFVLHWNVHNDTLLDDHDISQEFIDHLAPPVLFAQICEMDYHHLFTEFNVGTARQACLNTKVRMRTEYCLSERRRLEFECGRQADLLKARDGEIENLKAQLLLKEVEAAEAAHLGIQVSAVEAVEKVHADELNALKQKSVALEDERDSLNGKITELQSSVSAKDLELKDLNVHALETTCSSLRNQMALHLEEKFYPHLLTTISGRKWLLTRGLKLAVVKCFNSPEYLAALGATIRCAIEKGMKSGLSAVDFPLLSELSSHKDASVEDIMNLLRLEIPLVDAPRMNDLQPDVEQLMLPIHQSKDQVVLGETSLSFALNVAHSRIERIRENIAAQRSALVDVRVPLVDPLSAENLMGAAGTSDSMQATVATMTSLSTTFASISSVPLITVDDYEIAGADGQEDAQGNV